MFIKGEEVLVKDSNTNESQKAKILGNRGERYRVQLETGNEIHVHVTDLSKKVGRPSRSTIRSNIKDKQSPSRSSPSRKSPARYPRKSPKRHAKSPKRRSPRRSEKSPRRSDKSPKSEQFQLPSNKQTIKSTGLLAKVSLPRIEVPTDMLISDIIARRQDRESSVESLPLQSRLNERGTVIRRSARLLAGTPKPESDHKMVLLTRNINRAVSLPLERKGLMHDFIIEGKERGHSVQRDQDLLKTKNYEADVNLNTPVIEKRMKEIYMVSEPQEWGGWFGTLVLILLTPLLTILPQLMCTEYECMFESPKFPLDPNYYIDLKVSSAYLGFFLFVTLVSILPIGRKVDGPQNRIGRLEYRLNGFLCGILSVVIFAACIYQELEITDLIIDNYVQFSITGWILGVILSLLLFIKGGRAPVANLNIHGSTNSVIYNFWQGREINPRIGPVDFKINLFRTSMIAMILINLAIVMKAIEEIHDIYDLEQLNIGVSLCALLQIIYATDALFFESTMLTTFEVMYEGTGYMLCTGYLLFPFLPTLITKYMLYHKTEPSYVFVFPVLTFIIGYLLYRISNSQKNEFRKNPLSSSLAHLETISTIRGTKLIVSGLWGHVRHPNYLGDIVMWWSISCLSLACDILSYYYAIVCTGLLIHRAIRDNERCKTRYGLAWEQYMSRVKYMILYRVF